MSRLKAFPTRYPLSFSALLALVLSGLTYVSLAALPTYVAPTTEGLPVEALRQPSQGEAALAALRNSENLYYLLSALLAAALLTGLGWWREAGFGLRAPWMTNKLLLLFPLLVCALSLAGGVQFPRLALLVPALLGVLLAAFAG